MTAMTCQICGAEFEKDACDAATRRTCGRACADRLRWKNRRDRTGAREIRTLFALVAQTSHDTPDIEEQARIVGVTMSELYRLRFKAKTAGFDVAPVKARRNVSDRIVEIEAEMERGGACPRCFLHGAHQCTKEGLIELVESRISVWVEPSAYDVDEDDVPARKPATGLESVDRAAIVRGMDPLDLRRLLVAQGACNKRGTALPVPTEVIDRVIAESRKVAA